ncbi:hypothetical protein [Tuwongella immobilis]|uniref:Uncharacterized protein n=1 Tax=Tuwongella immobilis TaxID=692036 RepID=A0A6C2YMK9_9BACT|nr:hypothetical protein [Tuwongella immobilis]VIP02152.1 unnamed protein product [Tuwongella immobilis]VTS00543.1 unnamed protein product [Tuwongella immobilis]
MSDTPKWYTDLLVVYGPILGADQKGVMTVLLQWFRLFLQCGYRREEIEDGFATLAKDPNRPTYRQEMLVYIQRAIHQSRAAAKQSERVEEETAPPCDICGGSGIVVVPRLEDVEFGAWKFVQSIPGSKPRRWTSTVACSCPKGARTAEFTRSKDAQGKHRVTRPMRTLVNYESRNPHWREQLAEEEERQKLQRKVEGDTADLDHKSGRVKGLGAIPKEWLE